MSIKWWRPDKVAISLTLFAAQLFWSIVLCWPAFKCVATESPVALQYPLRLLLEYVVIVGVLGPLVGTLAVVSVRMGWKSASRWLKLQSLACAGTLAMAPLAIVAVLWLRAGAPNGAHPTDPSS